VGRRTQHLDVSLSDRTVVVTWRTHERARRLKVKVFRHGAVEVVTPPGVRADDVVSALFEHDVWIRERLDRVVEQRSKGPAPRPVRFATGDVLPVFGHPTPLVVLDEPRLRVRIDACGGTLRVRVPETLEESDRYRVIARGVERWLRQQLQPVVDDIVEDVSATWRLVPSKVTLVSPRRQWGSCAFDGTIRINWRLAFANRDVVKYVVVHELCHLEHRNHQRAFWELVEKLMPDYRRHQRWLREHAYLNYVLREPMWPVSRMLPSQQIEV
jgi:predicted metal-dependent hydrolase